MVQKILNGRLILGAATIFMRLEMMETKSKMATVRHLEFQKLALAVCLNTIAVCSRVEKQQILM